MDRSVSNRLSLFLVVSSESDVSSKAPQTPPPLAHHPSARLRSASLSVKKSWVKLGSGPGDAMGLVLEGRRCALRECADTPDVYPE